ncbi:MAG: N-acetylmuramoyl-L-alanine amidase-like domain-containing protein [Mangrovibacterium sp.]
MKFILTILLSIYISLGYANQPINVNDSLIFQQSIASSKSSKLSIGDDVILVGKSFLNTPYVSNTLEGNKREKLVINLSWVDCTTFVEYVLAIARSVHYGDSSFSEFRRELQEIRYRDGKLADYNSRLHYFSDWLYNNEQMGILVKLDSSFQQSYYKPINFMSNHQNNYPILKNNKSLLTEIKATEQALSSRKQFFIPKSNIADCESEFRNGDIVGITTNIAGLDIVHVGFIIFECGRAHLLHASSEKHKVVISEEPLADYLIRLKNRTGIMIARPQ